MMATDVLLDEPFANWLSLRAFAVKAEAADLMLDHPDRRRPNRGGPRRALVHDFNDGLTINYNNDYPGGVTLKNVAYISPMRPSSTGSGAIGPIGPVIMRRLVELKIDGGIRFKWDNGPSIRGTDLVEVSLQDLIATLQSRVADLEARVTELEA
jgi:hypothetical protein